MRRSRIGNRERNWAGESLDMVCTKPLKCGRVAEFYRVNVRVHWADTDAAGIVWFGNFLRFFEEAEDELFRALGRTRLELIRDFGILMPRVEATCRFRSPARAEEVLAIGIGVEEMTERRISYLFEARQR